LLFGEFPAETLTFHVPPAAAGVPPKKHVAAVADTLQPSRNVSPIEISSVPSVGKFAPSRTRVLVFVSTDAELIFIDVAAFAPNVVHMHSKLDPPMARHFFTSLIVILPT
jgi:hypothetical protein